MYKFIVDFSIGDNFMKKLYTIGHNGHGGLTGLINTLNDNDIKLVVDVRRKAWSAHPDYRKNNLKNWLDETGIYYVHIPEVAPSNEMRVWWNDILKKYPPAGEKVPFKEWEKYIEKFCTPELELQVQSLAEYIKEINITACLLCAENSAENCHRSIVADMLLYSKDPRTGKDILEDIETVEDL